MAPLAGLALAACTGPVTSVAPSTSTATGGPLLTPIEVQPAERAGAAIAAAFDADTASQLVVEVPADIDFARHALVCVYLGQRPTAGWGLDLASASVVDGELRIQARETRPRGAAAQVITYPAGCGLLDRSALPTGELPVRADDTISEEFIVDGTLRVPSAADAP